MKRIKVCLPNAFAGHPDPQMHTHYTVWLEMPGEGIRIACEENINEIREIAEAVSRITGFQIVDVDGKPAFFKTETSFRNI